VNILISMPARGLSGNVDLASPKIMAKYDYIEGL
jgi:hypothetical protein